MAGRHQVVSVITKTAQAVSVGAGRLTYRARMLPGFLIVGAQRSGTTSMYRALSQHPAVVKAVTAQGGALLRYQYGRGIGWYRAHFRSMAHARRVDGADCHRVR